MKILLLATIFVLFNSCHNQKQDPYVGLNYVIYGEDNRVEVKDHPDKKMRDFANAVAVMVDQRQLREHPQNPDLYKYNKIPAYAPYDLCQDDPFTTQHTLSNCNAFLVSKDVLLTAGHCINDLAECHNKSFIFNYFNDDGTIAKKDLYQCETILATGVNDGHYRDYSIIKLAREVDNVIPLNVNTEPLTEEKIPVTLIGSPFGVPLKIADGAMITSPISTVDALTILASQASEQDKHLKLLASDYFMATIDSFSGNSGSPVINEQTGLVEGIVSHGANDWYYDDEHYCFRNVIKKSGEAAEELIYKISSNKKLTEIILP